MRGTNLKIHQDESNGQQCGHECSEGRAWSSGRSGWKSCKGRGGEIAALSSRVLGGTTNLTTPKVATRPKLGLWNLGHEPERSRLEVPIVLVWKYR